MNGFKFIPTIFDSEEFFATFSGFEETVIAAPETILPEALVTQLQETLESIPDTDLIAVDMRTPDGASCGFVVWRMPAGCDAYEFVEEGEPQFAFAAPSSLLVVMAEDTVDAFDELRDEMGDSFDDEDEPEQVTYADCYDLAVEDVLNIGTPMLVFNGGMALCNPASAADVLE